MLGAGIYPITIAEMAQYTEEADEWFDVDDHERLKEFLALHPESGDVLAGTNGLRILRWPIKSGGMGSRRSRVVYYFRDLNMPLYLIALYRQGERLNLNSVLRNELSLLVDELVAQHSKGWAAHNIRLDRGG